MKTMDKMWKRLVCSANKIKHVGSEIGCSVHPQQPKGKTRFNRELEVLVHYMVLIGNHVDGAVVH